jgi:mRNA-degrading endonuclease RelE of RelBE toxin-antitoxin system
MVRALSVEVRRQLYERMDELLKGLVTGEPLRGPYKRFKKIRIGKFRLIYSDAKPCIISFYKLRHRESAYV